MNTTVSKSFGLALLLAVGIIAVMVAMGAFTSQRAGAQVTSDTIVVDSNAPPPGAVVEVKLTVDFDSGQGVDSFGALEIELKGYGIPDSIDPRDVLLRNTGGTVENGNPVDVNVTGGVITLELNEDATAGTAGISDGQDDVIIVLRKRAGITAPALAGSYDVTVGGETAEDAVTVSAVLKLDPTKGGSGTEITVSGKAFANGTGTLYTRAGGEEGDGKALKDVTVADGAFSTTVAAKDLVKNTADGISVIEIVDANGGSDDENFEVTGTTTLGSDSVGKGKLLKISIADWISLVPDTVKIGGVGVDIVNADGQTHTVALDVDKAATFYVKVSGAVGLGTKTVVLFDTNNDTPDDATDDEDTRLDSASVEITAVALTVSPSTAVVGREVTITGSGFTGTVDSIKIGDATVCEGTDNCDIEVASGGRVVAAFNIPNDAALDDAGDYTITVTDSGSRIGTGTVTIPERTLTVDPAESRIGTTIGISGTGWPTGTGANLVGIFYDSVQYATAITAADGRWSASIGVPTAANVGETHTVEAMATVGGASEPNVTQDADHKTPDAVVTLSSAQAQRGTTITVSGENFNVFRPVTIEIDGSNVAPSATTTDGTGSFSAEVRVPGLSLGNKNLKVSVNNVPVVEFLEIVATPVETTKAIGDVFKDLIDNGSLNVVWRYDIAAPAGQRWTSYTTDPDTAFANDLFEVESSDILNINVDGEQEFSHQRGDTIPDGWSLITLK